MGWRCGLAGWNVWGLGIAASCYCLFYLGTVLRRTTRESIPAYQRGIFAAAAFAVLLILGRLGSVGLAGNGYSSPIFLLAASLAGWVLVREAACLTAPLPCIRAVLAYLGRATMPIVILHFLSFKLVTWLGLLATGGEPYLLAAFPIYFTGGAWWLAYTLPMNNVVTATVNAPWVDSYYDRTEVCDVPASLDKQARAALASAYYFQYHWWGMHAGFLPYEKLDEPVGFFNYRAADGAFYTKFSEFGSFLHTVYSDAWVDDMLSMDPAPFAEGENDTILTLDGDRGGNIAYCGHLFTEPELQPDGSLAFWQLSLTCESDDFKGWAGEETIVPDTATVTTVRLVPTENGWRVDALELPS